MKERIFIMERASIRGSIETKALYPFTKTKFIKFTKLIILSLSFGWCVRIISRQGYQLLCTPVDLTPTPSGALISCPSVQVSDRCKALLPLVLEGITSSELFTYFVTPPRFHAAFNAYRMYPLLFPIKLYHQIIIIF